MGARGAPFESLAFFASPASRFLFSPAVALAARAFFASFDAFGGILTWATAIALSVFSKSGGITAAPVSGWCYLTTL